MWWAIQSLEPPSALRSFLKEVSIKALVKSSIFPLSWSNWYTTACHNAACDLSNASNGRFSTGATIACTFCLNTKQAITRWLMTHFLQDSLGKIKPEKTLIWSKVANFLKISKDALKQRLVDNDPMMIKPLHQTCSNKFCKKTNRSQSHNSRERVGSSSRYGRYVHTYLCSTHHNFNKKTHDFWGRVLNMVLGSALVIRHSHGWHCQCPGHPQ